ncbi:phenylalanine--tRNA ligase subunit alpha [Candidatus Riesia sp. GBBU]|nr:phenylalanine--tRNA ligase subunit alpha [Candidatus Riesia sp. GBBU]
MEKLNLLRILKKAELEIQNSNSLSDLNIIKSKFIGKKSYLFRIISSLNILSKDNKIIVGKKVNFIKKNIKKLLDKRKKTLSRLEINKKIHTEDIDISLPGCRKGIGTIHPINSIIHRVKKYFFNLGFSIVYGPEIEDEYYNFDALNIPKNHPSRNKKDTFWINEKKLLRTQTSCVQIRILEKTKPPIRIISPGCVYRKDFDKTHSPMFHQIEGIVIDKNVSFSNLKHILFKFFDYFFIEEFKIRMRPSYFPFTKISAEIDILDKNKKWIEVIGCGMIHRKVFKNVQIDNNLYSGFAFGIGIERLTMLFYNIDDLRILFKNNVRFLRQFK